MSRLRWTWLLAALAASAVLPALFYDVAATAFDAGTVHIYQGVTYSHAIDEGLIYPRWVQFLHWGLGSPLFIFRPPLPYVAMDLLSRAGLAHPAGWGVLMALGLLLSAVGAYVLAFSLTGRRWPAVLAAAAYLYAPYVLRNVFVRGSTEVFSMFLYPWVLWALIWLARNPAAGRALLAASLWAWTIASHVLGPLILAPAAGLVALVAAWRRRTAAPLLVLLAGALLTAFVWLPIYAERSNVQLDRDFGTAQGDPQRNPITVDQLLAPPPIYDVQRDNNAPGESMGLLHGLLLAAGIPAACIAWRRKRRQLALLLAAGTAGGLIIFWLMTPSSDFAWGTFAGVLTALQYRSRLLGLQAVAIAVVAAAEMALLPLMWQRPAALLAAALMIVLSWSTLYTDLQHRYAPFSGRVTMADVREAEVRSGGSAFTAFGEFTPRWRTAPFDRDLAQQLGANFDAEAQPLAEPMSGLRIASTRVLSGKWDVTFTADSPTLMTLHLLYYPHWQAYLDGSPVEVRPQPETGYLQLDVPAGQHELALRFRGTAAEAPGAGISGLTLAGLLAAVLRSRGLRKTVEFQPAVDEEVTPGERAPTWTVLAGVTALLVIKFAYVDPATTWFRCSSSAISVCGAAHVTNVAFTAAPSLRGYTVETPVLAPGGTVRLSLVWQLNQVTRPGLSTFVHIRNSQGRPLNSRTGGDIWAQEEHNSPAGLLITDWVTGKLYLDEFRIPLPEDLPPGPYLLEIGWFDPVSGEQLEPDRATLTPPLSELWRSVLLPSIQVQ